MFPKVPAQEDRCWPLYVIGLRSENQGKYIGEKISVVALLRPACLIVQIMKQKVAVR